MSPDANESLKVPERITRINQKTGFATLPIQTEPPHIKSAKMAPTQKKAIATTVNDFVVLPIRFPALQSYPKETTHHLYIRANTPKVPTPDTPRELFLVNVPSDATETHIRSLFADQLGGARIENVAFEGARVGKGITAPVAPAQKKKRKRDDQDGEEEQTAAQVGHLPKTYDRSIHRSGSTAVATFVDKASAELALKEAKKAIKAGKNITWASGIESKLPPPRQCPLPLAPQPALPLAPCPASLDRRLHDGPLGAGSRQGPRAEQAALAAGRGRFHHRRARRKGRRGARGGCARQGRGAGQEAEEDDRGGLLPLPGARQEEVRGEGFGARVRGGQEAGRGDEEEEGQSQARVIFESLEEMLAKRICLCVCLPAGWLAGWLAVYVVATSLLLVRGLSIREWHASMHATEAAHPEIKIASHPPLPCVGRFHSLVSPAAFEGAVSVKEKSAR